MTDQEPNNNTEQDLFKDLEVHLDSTNEYEIIDGLTYYYGKAIRTILDKYRRQQGD